MVRVAPLVLSVLIASCGVAQAQLPDLCKAAIAMTERQTGVPDRLMQAISIIESGRRDPGGSAVAWPWTINVEGVGEVFDSKQQAIAAVTAHRARGARSIDVGCMQVNLMHHADAFASLDEAFDPAANARYAARFLQQLLNQTGSWPLAVAGYHSLTPDIGGDYARKVLAIWARPEPGRRTQKAVAALPSPGVAIASAAPSMPPPTRTMPAPGNAMPSFTGRGLDAYRAMPTRLATSTMFRRS